MATKAETIEGVRKLISIIDSSSSQIVESTAPLYQLINVLERTNSSRGLRYTLDSLKFVNVSEQQFICRDTWKAGSLDVRLHVSVSLMPNLDFEFGNVNESVIEITYEAINNSDKIARGAWHLDCHGHHSGVPDFIHPSNHIHHGGRKVKDNTQDYGELVLLDAPRLMHPPLDIFLAFDFLLTNFIERRIWQSFREDTRYKELIKLAQVKWWQKYYQQIADYWNHQTSGKDDVEKRQTAQLAIPYLYI
ncbi:hypothetical protein NOK90_17005 [Vibrio parahaemolyticus]|uniref:hypothetical protein n=1 Tax=Vibrio TaxID=662 RepID=UPI00226B603F|nr:MULTISPECIES: hypothetical protein [Vibrio]EJL6733948.1 hypothetical protein [Vibrio alginolyticus]MCX8792454.1 hypothetical protein [Vibrio parahaemolyticus]MDG2722929.1 hypothetical protein [Vibrio parahaemolyticus]MDW1893466.1 hypothetical protein [Vibrio sp. Vb1729]